ncbi:VanZ family protein [Domibacillus sp. PGB-M46]|uniref:VanZ family protein n=1 Tax=Domibacillus sp. PGB-M46 TaxID=2910255 RepID=UPI001F567722|nr:VanZ family protein [Domibacillus sp. PGB-M46]MCI2253848.1 VanZ family protein [Domibacillus sp. PGB-M46]
MKKGIRFLITGLPVLYMIAIWIMSGLPHDTIMDLPNNKVDLFIKESLHLVEFAILYGLIVLALLANGKLTPLTSLAAAMFASFYGLTDEIHQAFVPYRSATLIDAVKDVIGVTIAFLAVNYFYFERKSRIGRWLAGFGEWTRPQ